MCHPLLAVNRGSISYTPHSVSVNGNYGSGTVAIHSCDENYGLDGESIRICNDSSQWTGAAPTCEGEL